MIFSPSKTLLTLNTLCPPPSDFNNINFSCLRVTASAIAFFLLLLGGFAATGAPLTQATFLQTDALTQGNWATTYGADGYQIINQTTSLPDYARLSASGQTDWTWAATTSDKRALQKPGATDRIAATWFSNNSFTCDLNITDGGQHQVALYFLDWDDRGRTQRVDVLDAASGVQLDSRTISNFAGGIYLTWSLRGNVRFRITRLAGSNAVLSGLIFGTNAVAQLRPVQSTVSFVKVDTATQGNWKSAYGREGYYVINDATLAPTYGAVNATGQSSWTWSGNTTETRALERVNTAAGRIAASWYAVKTFTLDLNLTDGLVHQVAFHALDWDYRGRTQKLEVLEGTTVRDSRTISSFGNGQYVVWNLSGRLQLRVTCLSGDNAVIGGIFFGGAFSSTPAASPTPATRPAPSPSVTPTPTPNPVDTAAPVLSGISTANLTSGSVSVNWTTNENSDSKVEYGLTTAYGNVRSVANSVTGHQVDLIGLSPSTLYHYRVSSKDAAGNTATSGNFTFTTPSNTTTVAGDPELPRVLLNTTFAAPVGRTITVNAGADLQAAFNAAVPGDTLVLQTGATFVAPDGGFVLPAKSNPNNQWIVVRTANLASLPLEGVRVTPAYASAMPKILSSNTSPALVTASGASYWRLIGLEVSLTSSAVTDATVSGATVNYGLINLGSAGETNAANLATDVIIDRCYVHGLPRKNVRRGITLNSRRTSVIDSWLAEFHEIGSDSQAICGWNGPGPFKIVNNYLEGSGENVMFGGSDPRVYNLVPSDIEFRRNHLFKPTSWFSASSSYAGIAWTVKNIFELKNARRVWLDGNVFENNWAQAQNGFAILCTVRNQEGTAPWSTVEDVTFTNNLVRHVSSGINILGRDNLQTSGQARRLKFKNNLFEDINAGTWGGIGRFLQLTDTADAKFENNTIFHTGNICTAYTNLNTPSNTGFVYRNNLSAHNDYGFIGDGTGVGNITLNTYFPSAIFLNNILAGGPASAYPAGNYFPASLGGVGFVNLTGGDYHLSSTSPYKNRGSDSADPGVDVDKLRNAIAGVTL